MTRVVMLPHKGYATTTDHVTISRYLFKEYFS